MSRRISLRLPWPSIEWRRAKKGRHLHHLHHLRRLCLCSPLLSVSPLPKADCNRTGAHQQQLVHRLEATIIQWPLSRLPQHPAPITTLPNGRDAYLRHWYHHSSHLRYHHHPKWIWCVTRTRNLSFHKFFANFILLVASHHSRSNTPERPTRPESESYGRKPEFSSSFEKFFTKGNTHSGSSNASASASSSSIHHNMYRVGSSNNVVAAAAAAGDTMTGNSMTRRWSRTSDHSSINMVSL